jgi:hypothetical protein
MVEHSVEQTTQILSCLWRFLMLPVHSWRIAAIHLLRERIGYESRQDLKLEVDRFIEFDNQVRELESRLADSLSNLSLEASKALAVKAYLAALTRLEQRMKENTPVEFAKY